MASVFWNKYRILLVDCLKKGATITESYYTSLLDNVKQAMVSKQQRKL
jgi:Transposase.